jgi:hypothetical protein
VLNIDLVLVSEAVRSGFANRSGRRVVRVQERDEAEAMRLAPAIPTNNSESVSIAFFSRYRCGLLCRGVRAYLRLGSTPTPSGEPRHSSLLAFSRNEDSFLGFRSYKIVAGQTCRRESFSYQLSARLSETR